jgi:hypothetical protein
MASPSKTTLELLQRIKEQGVQAIVRVQKSVAQLAQKTTSAAQTQRQEAQADIAGLKGEVVVGSSFDAFTTKLDPLQGGEV